MLALRQYEADLCVCGHPRSQTMSPDHDPHDPKSPAVYEAGTPWRCHACTAVARAQQEHEKALGEHTDSMAGLKWGVELIERRAHNP